MIMRRDAESHKATIANFFDENPQAWIDHYRDETRETIREHTFRTRRRVVLGLFDRDNGDVLDVG
jgi:hypothetical protein